MLEHQHLRFLDVAERNAEEVADANVDSHPHALNGTAHDDAFAMNFDLPDAAIGTHVVRGEAHWQRKRVEPHCAARPGGIDPACCCLTPHDFFLPAGIMFPVDTRDLSRAAPGLA